MPARPLSPFKARFEPELYEELQTVAGLMRSSINQFVNSAVRAHLRRTRASLVDEYEGALERLRAYSSRDPDFEEAIEAVVASEVGHSDPVEGQIVVDSKSRLSEDERRLEDILDGIV